MIRIFHNRLLWIEHYPPLAKPPASGHGQTFFPDALDSIRASGNRARRWFRSQVWRRSGGEITHGRDDEASISRHRPQAPRVHYYH